MRKRRNALFSSILALLLSVSMLIGSTMAWFTDSVVSQDNIIQSGNLDLEMYWAEDPVNGPWYDVEDPAYNTVFDYENWEPGYTEVKYIKLVNNGNLALNYDLTIAPQGTVGKLAEVINVYYAKSAVALSQRSELSSLNCIGLLQNVMNGGATASGTLLPASEQSLTHDSGEVILTVAMEMITTAGNEYQGETSGDFTITALATQAPYEADSFDNAYDNSAEYPFVYTASSITVPVTAVNGMVGVGGVNMTGASVAAYLPEGVALADGITELTLNITPKLATDSGLTAVNNEILIPVDVHIDGVASTNTVPIVINLGRLLPKYLNMGNYSLVHVENGSNCVMTLVDDEAQLTAHNQYTYDAATGEVSVCMATFSEISALVDLDNGWSGDYANADREFAGAGTAADPYIISTADELAGLSELISTDSAWGDEHYKLVSDINLNKKIWYPIGYRKVGDGKNAAGETWYTYGGAFTGTFDGNGHTVSGIRQNTWALDGNYDAGYYNEAMGLFGYVVDGTVKNLTVKDFVTEGEFTPTGVITAYASGECTFENIALVDCNPQVYNTGNGGIVGWDEGADEGTHYTFSNITIDNSNKITALWGSWDVACGGLMGYLGPKSTVNMRNCHVAAQIDVYNDVCGNYQYYWYRYSGMMIGTIDRHKTENGYTVPDTTGIVAENCTVHFGSWNDYYYCELVANSLASYTHDHQFSRLTRISSLSEIKNGEDWIKAGNYLLINEDEQTCYHIVKNSDGTLVQHKHEDSGEETVNGETVLKEDKQIVYLPFNQLFTGYGWGVKHVPVFNGEDYAFEGIKILDREVADSVEKFKTAENVSTVYGTGKTVTIGQLFAKADSGVAIDSNTVQVFVSPADNVSTVYGTYTANTTDWTQGTLTFSGRGAATVSITDYYFCKTTTLDVQVLGGEYYIATKRSSGNYFYMTNDLGTASKSRYQAEDSGLTELPDVILSPEISKQFTLVPQSGNTFKVLSNDQYLGWSSDNTGILVTENEAKLITIAETSDKMLNLTIESGARFLSLNNNSDNNYFAWYAGTQIQDLTLIPVQTCAHTNRETSALEETCTDDGYTGRVTCLDCGDILNQGTVVPAGHKFGDDTVCDRCGLNTEETEKTYIFSNYAAGAQYGKNEEHTLDDDITVTTNDCYFTEELRIYSSSTNNGYAIIKAAEGRLISELAFNAGNKVDTVNVYGSNDGGATWTLIQGVKVTTTSYKDYTVDFANQTYSMLKLDVAGTNQVRLKSMTVSLFGASCAHTNTTTETQNATCTEAGYTDRITCDDCGAVLNEGTPTLALGHTYVNGTCSVCGATETTGEQWVLVTDASQLVAGKQIVIVNMDCSYALSTNQKSNNRGAVAVTKDGDTIVVSEDIQQLTLESGTTTGTFALNTGAGYLYAASGSSNQLKTQATLDANGSWEITVAADGTATIVAQGTNSRNTMQYNYNGGSPLFACYSGASQTDVAIYVFE